MPRDLQVGNDISNPRDAETPPASGPGGKKNRQKERRLMKGFLSTTAASASSPAAALPSTLSVSGGNNSAVAAGTSRQLSSGERADQTPRVAGRDHLKSPLSLALVKYCLIKSHFECGRMIHDGSVIVVYCF